MSHENSDFSDTGGSDSDGDWQNNESSESEDENISLPSTDDDNDDDLAVQDRQEVGDGEPLNWQETYEQIDIDPFIQNTGPSHNLPAGSSELEYFKLFFSDSMIDNLVTETNRYATQNGPDPLWTETTRAEMSAFLGTYFFFIISYSCVLATARIINNSIVLLITILMYYTTERTKVNKNVLNK